MSRTKEYDATAEAVAQKLSKLYESLNANERRVMDSILASAGAGDDKVNSAVNVELQGNVVSLISTVAHW